MSRLGALVRELRRLKRAAERAELAHLGIGSHGDEVSIGDGCELSPAQNIVMGDRVFVGRDCWFSAPNAKIIIGSEVMFGPQVAIITGDHNFSVVGASMYRTHEKRPEDDRDVVIEDDVWVGFRATVLRGVTLGRGSIVGACAVVTKDVPRYAIVAGNPARVIGMRFNPQQILEHERLLGISEDKEISG